MTDQQYVLITVGHGTPGGPEIAAYSSPDVNADQLTQAGHLLADGAEPPMTFKVLPLQPAKWDSL